MTPTLDQRRSPAVKASWASLGLALGCACAFLVFQALDAAAPFEQTRQGVLTGIVPRTLLYLLWAGEALAVVAGGAGLVLIRRPDVVSQSLAGILVRSLSGIMIGLPGVIFFWLYVGYRVVGF